MVLRADARTSSRSHGTRRFHLIAHELNSLASPNEAIFYTSGKARNEVAFA